MSNQISEFKTLLGNRVPKNCRGILYLCKVDKENLTIEVFSERLYDNAFDTLNAYANTPNSASQMVDGKTFEGLINNLTTLHKNMNDPEWVKQLIETL